MPNAAELFQLADDGKLGRIHFVTGLYFKRRESAVYAYLLEGLRKRGGTYRAFPNHSKVLLLANQAQGHYLTVEGSGNFTANPQHEQETIINDRGLWEFHRQWFAEMLVSVPEEKPTDAQPAGPAPSRNCTMTQNTLDKLVLLIVSLADRTKVAAAATDKLDINPAEVHVAISEAYEKIRAAARWAAGRGPWGKHRPLE